ncbi:hypothetical protein BAY59_31585 [Prauserella coralliicola]|nr:hypothetical protein BAY59_31585 [Prauserella coralliicola]
MMAAWPRSPRTSRTGRHSTVSTCGGPLGAYRFTPPGTRAGVFSIGTPPPTVSGSLHIGHAFSCTHTDIVARFQRMRGGHVCYPMGEVALGV